ncbi:MAG TPA: hypothetical protein VEF34_16955 [Syntrophobacteraceae bacterium]|nr:hypothetical protein [Syntrophobacteraceae bacterium]
MKEFFTYGSVRGVPGDRHPYRDKEGLRFAWVRLKAEPFSKQKKPVQILCCSYLRFILKEEGFEVKSALFFAGDGWGSPTAYGTGVMRGYTD